VGGEKKNLAALNGEREGRQIDALVISWCNWDLYSWKIGCMNCEQWYVLLVYWCFGKKMGW